MSAGWIRHSIWWHVYPLGFTGADTTGADRSPGLGLDHLTGWLDHAVELGANGLALGPVFESSTHGYDTIDYFHVDSRLGGDDAFARLIAGCRERGIRIMLDGVFNHVGPRFGHDDWLRRGRDGATRTFEGHAGLPVLDHDDPEVVEHVVTVMDHWLDAGADAWRLDAAYAVSPRFWARVLPRIRDKHPDAYVLGEMLHGDYAAYVKDSGIDAVTQYELWKAIWSSLASSNFFALDHALGRHNEFFDSFVPWTFVGNHDVTRIASQLPDARHRAHALVLLMTLGGTPAVYYGDEFGFEAVKEDRAGGDDAIRPAYPAPGDDFGDHDVLRLHQDLIGLRRRLPWLHDARSETTTLTNETIVLRVSAGDESTAASVTVALNLSDDPLPVRAGEVLAGALDSGAVPPHGWAVLG